MRERHQLIATVTMLALTSVPLLAQAPRDDGKILEELKALREKVEALEKVIQELKAKLEERRTEDKDPLPLPPGRKQQQADRKLLRTIQLPETPTRRDVEAYIDAIIDASRFQNSYSTEDPQISMLAKVGKQNVDLLVEKYSPGSSLYFDAALERLAGAEHKQLLIESLGVSPGLVKVVVAKGWAQDARQVLLDGLAGRPNYLPVEWIDAVARFKDPATYEDLAFYFVHGTNPSWTYEAIKALPGFDVDAPVAEAWKLEKAGVRGFPPGAKGEDLALIAFAHGHEDAIEPTFLCLKKSEEWQQKHARDVILKHTEATGSGEEILAWYELRKGRLHWDREQRKYREADK